MRKSRFAMGLATAALLLVPAAQAASPEVEAAETQMSIGIGALHTQYHENLNPGDDENGAAAGFGVAISGLIPFYPGRPTYPDIYTYLGYEFNAGDLQYGGHYQFSGLPAQATDNAVFNRIEARIGVGVPLQGGAELIPFLAAGYQSWNRNINQKDVIGTDEFYHAGLFGGGLKLDVPVTPQLVLSATGEFLAVAEAGIDAHGIGVIGSLGAAGEARLTLGADFAITPRLHTFADVYLEHFNYAGSRPNYNVLPGYYVYEPLSTTTQFGGMAGVGYSFN
jgi:hypothetical protein